MIEAEQAIVCGLTSLATGSGKHGAARVSSVTARTVERALKVAAI
jgi:hypothetical protein